MRVLAAASSTLALFACLLAAPAARAEPPASAALTPEAYAQSEVRAGAGRIAFGVASLGGGAFALASDSRFAHGLAAPLFAGGAVFGTLGALSLVRASRIEGEIDRGTAYVPLEEERTSRLRLHLSVAQALEASAFAAGGAIAYFGGSDDGLRGLGMGIAIESAALLLADVFAQSRAERFARGLGELHVGFAPAPRGGALALSGVFR